MQVLLKVVVDLKEPIPVEEADGQLKKCVAYARYYGVTGDNLDEIAAFVLNDVSDGVVFTMDGDTANLGKIEARMYNTGHTPHERGIWHKSGRMLLEAADRALIITEN